MTTDAALAERIGRAFVDAFNRRDIDGLVALCDPAIKFYPTMLTGTQRHYVGHDGLRLWGKDLLASDAKHFARVREVRLLDEERFAVLTEVLQDGDALMSSAMIARLAGGKLVEVRAYLTDDATLEQLGRLE